MADQAGVDYTSGLKGTHGRVNVNRFAYEPATLGREPPVFDNIYGVLASVMANGYHALESSSMVVLAMTPFNHLDGDKLRPTNEQR